MTNFVPQIRVFLASPGDVNEERAVALQVLDMLEYDPLFRKEGAGGVSIHAIAWDKPGGDVPMRATKTPQTAIKEGLPKPSDCDIVVVLFWSRMGTPLPHPEYQKEDGSPYLSGTEWEFRDAFDAERKNGKPITLIYRRTEEPKFDRKDRKAAEQYYKVLEFFDQFRDSDTGALSGGFNEYTNPEEFRQKLVNHLRYELDKLLNGVVAPAPEPVAPAPPLWPGSPFPGLHPFTEEDAPIFFGRGLEIAQLVKVIEANRFAAVVAASGSGKSSLVAAGLIPRLKANAIVSEKIGSADWRFVRFTPDEYDNPLEGLFHALNKAFPEHKVSPMMIVQEKKAFIESITDNPKALIEICDALVTEAKAPAWTEILLFIDQFEELFTVVSPTDRETLVAVLDAVSQSTRLRCIITMRSDFYANCLELPKLADLLKSGTYPLTVPTAGALIEMIEKPASRAGLSWDEGLPDKIQADTGTGAGALALMAYALDELYHSVGDDKRLTYTAYEALGGVEGAIGKRAESTYNTLELDDKEVILQQVFRELVAVDERGTATRQRANLSRFSEAQRTLIDAFVTARLLVTHEETVEVAHEAIFRSWKRLVEWIESAQEDLILLRQVKTAAAEWARQEKKDAFRWAHERLEPVYLMVERLQPELSAIEKAFIEPEQERLYRELGDISTTHQRRYDIGERLARIGDIRDGIGVKDGKPDMLWLPVNGSGGKYKFGFGEFEVSDFFIAKYLTTKAQVDAFLASNWDDLRWWQGFPEDYQPQRFGNVINGNSNAPRDTISWYQSVAFGRWMTAQFDGLELEHPSGVILRVGDTAQIRLPTEWEWQWAAMAGEEERKYPWGDWDEHPRANTTEAGINDRSTAVGMYPHGVAECGVLDMAGNLWEWCQNDRDKPEILDGFGNGESKVLRGGSFAYDQYYAAAAYRYSNDPHNDPNPYGVRLVVAPYVASLTSVSLDSDL